MRIIILAIIFSISLNIVSAQETNKAGTSAAQFLKIGVGAREIAMAGATAATVNNENSMYWNPAGLVNVQRVSVAATYTNWFADLEHNYFALVLPVSSDQTVGINATVLSMGKMEVTTEIDPTGTGEFFEASDVAVGVTYSARLVSFFTFGINVKYITQSVYNETASTVAFDIGTHLNTGYAGLKIGMAFSNFGGKLKLEGRDLLRTYDPSPNNAANTQVKSNLQTEEWEIPTNFRVGIGWDILNKYDAAWISNEHKMTVALDANHPNDALENIAVGMEYTWRQLISFRTGYHYNDDVRRFVVGMGLNWAVSNSMVIGIDYAYADLIKLGDVHSFSIKLGF